MLFDEELDGPILAGLDDEKPKKYSVKYKEGNRAWNDLNLGEGPYNMMMWFVIDYRKKYPKDRYKYTFALKEVR